MNMCRAVADTNFPKDDLLDTFWKKRYSKEFHTEVLGRLDNDEYAKIKENISNWYKIQDEILTDLFKKKSDRTLKTTFLRVKLLNEFYSTNVPNICIFNIAKEIAKDNELHKNIIKSNAITDRKSAAVNKITKILDEVLPEDSSLNKDLYSFATKYCHFLNPKEFSIFDRYVCFSLRDYIIKYYEEKDFSIIIQEYNQRSDSKIQIIKKPTKTSIEVALRDYSFFMKFIDIFIIKCNLKNSYAHKRAKIDNYLWLSGMMLYKKTSKVAEKYKS